MPSGGDSAKIIGGPHRTQPDRLAGRARWGFALIKKARSRPLSSQASNVSRTPGRPGRSPRDAVRDAGDDDLQPHPQPSAPPLPPLGESPRLLTKAEVCAITGKSFVTLWTWMRQNRFPLPRAVSGRPHWISTEIDQWLKQLPVRAYKKPGDDNA